MEIYLNITGLNIKILNFPLTEIPEQLKNFQASFPDDKADISYHVKYYAEPPVVKGQCIFDKKTQQIYKSNSVYTLAFLYPNNKTYYTIFNCKTGCAEIWMPDDYLEHYFTPRLFISFLALDFVFLLFERIMMHASIVMYHSDAILFTGPSGIGKSTQADLWEKYMDADILNGDRAILKTNCEMPPLQGNHNMHEHQQAPYGMMKAYGSPYAGSSNIYRNDSALVKAIVLLEQSMTNSIEKIEGKTAYGVMFPRFSIAKWDRDIFNLCMDMIEQIIEKIPIYKLSCRPDKEAVELLYKTLYKDNNRK